MNAKLVRIPVLAFGAVLMVACAQPIKNVESQPIEVGDAYDLDDVTKAIKRAGAGLGWVVKEQTPGHAVATLHIRRHMAQVDINYTLEEFSITYKDSTNLDFDGTNIHRNYNGWIQNLDNAIRVQLSML